MNSDFGIRIHFTTRPSWFKDFRLAKPRVAVEPKIALVPYRNRSLSIEIGSLIRAPDWLGSILVEVVTIGNQYEALSDLSVAIIISTREITLYDTRMNVLLSDPINDRQRDLT